MNINKFFEDLTDEDLKQAFKELEELDKVGFIKEGLIREIADKINEEYNFAGIDFTVKKFRELMSERFYQLIKEKEGKEEKKEKLIGLDKVKFKTTSIINEVEKEDYISIVNIKDQEHFLFDMSNLDFDKQKTISIKLPFNLKVAFAILNMERNTCIDVEIENQKSDKMFIVENNQRKEFKNAGGYSLVCNYENIEKEVKI